MKVSVADFKNAVVVLEAKMIEGFEKTIDKGALGGVFFKYAPQIDEAIVKASKDGMVNCDELREFVNAVVTSAGGKIVLEPEIPALARLVGVTIKNITITQRDVDDFFEVTIPQVSPSAIR